jgi:hypothetical protein
MSRAASWAHRHRHRRHHGPARTRPRAGRRRRRGLQRRAPVPGRHRRNPPVHLRLRPARQGDLHGRGTLPADGRDLPGPGQSRCPVALGPVGKGLNGPAVGTRLPRVGAGAQGALERLLVIHNAEYRLRFSRSRKANPLTGPISGNRLLESMKEAASWAGEDRNTVVSLATALVAARADAEGSRYFLDRSERNPADATAQALAGFFQVRPGHGMGRGAHLAGPGRGHGPWPATVLPRPGPGRTGARAAAAGGCGSQTDRDLTRAARSKQRRPSTCSPGKRRTPSSPPRPPGRPGRPGPRAGNPRSGPAPAPRQPRASRAPARGSGPADGAAPVVRSVRLPRLRRAGWALSSPGRIAAVIWAHAADQGQPTRPGSYPVLGRLEAPKPRRS